MPYVQLQVRRGTSSEWSSAAALAEGELAYETDTNKLKIGNGTSLWAALPYVNKGDTGEQGPANGPTGPSGPSGATGVQGATGITGSNGAGWSGQYIRVGITSDSTGALFTPDSALTSGYTRGTWTVGSNRATLTISGGDSIIPPVIFGYIAWNTALTGSPVYKVVSLPYGSSSLDYPQLTVSRVGSNWVIDIDIAAATFDDAKNIAGTSPAYGAFIYL
jgi:hypothetical protein